MHLNGFSSGGTVYPHVIALREPDRELFLEVLLITELTSVKEAHLKVIERTFYFQILTWFTRVYG